MPRNQPVQHQSLLSLRRTLHTRSDKELQDACERNGLKYTGKREDLIESLYQLQARHLDRTKAKPTEATKVRGELCIIVQEH